MSLWRGLSDSARYCGTRFLGAEAMSARAIVTGSLYRAAEDRISKNGKLFATFTLKENIDGVPRWWKAVAFNEAVIASVKALKEGEPLSIAGNFDCELYTPDNCGEPRLSWRITAEAVLTARMVKEAR